LNILLPKTEGEREVEEKEPKKIKKKRSRVLVRRRRRGGIGERIEEVFEKESEEREMNIESE